MQQMNEIRQEITEPWELLTIRKSDSGGLNPPLASRNRIPWANVRFPFPAPWHADILSQH